MWYEIPKAGRCEMMGMLTLSDIILHRNHQNKAAAVAGLQISPRGACNDRDQTPHSETQKYFNYTDSGSFVILFESQL